MLKKVLEGIKRAFRILPALLWWSRFACRKKVPAFMNIETIRNLSRIRFWILERIQALCAVSMGIQNRKRMATTALTSAIMGQAWACCGGIARGICADQSCFIGIRANGVQAKQETSSRHFQRFQIKLSGRIAHRRSLIADLSGKAWHW